MVVQEKTKTYLVLGLAVVALWVIWYTHDFRTHARIHFLDVGQADATLIHAPTGEQMLVDCGKDGRGLEALQRTQNYFDFTIEYLVITHADLDHFGGCMEIIKHYSVEHILYSGLDKPNDARWAALWEEVEAEGSVVVAITEPHEWELGEVRIRTVFPHYDIHATPELKGNNASVVLRVDSANGSYLLTGDAEREQEELLIAHGGELIDVDVLKAGHHGSKTSSIEEFVIATSPHTTVISAGANNRYGHPHSRVMARFKRHGVEIKQTAVEGDISFMLY